nr:PREDICTED: uncharacterized protein LOC109041994 [Bemisia tabaci]
MRVGTIRTFVVLATALFAVRLHGAQRSIRTLIQAHAKVDPCKFSIPQSEKVGDWKCRNAFSLLDRLPPEEIPIPCQKLMRREDGGPHCRDSPEGMKKCSVKGGVLFLQRLLQPEMWELGERDQFVTFSYCIMFLRHREPDVPLSRTTDLVQNYLYPSSGGIVHRTVTRTGKQLAKIHSRALQATEGMK